MIRKVITPSNETISIELPQSFVGKQVEVIMFISDEVNEMPHVVGNPSKHAIANKILSSDWLPYREENVWRDL